jgi:hypothetical protein
MNRWWAFGCQSCGHLTVDHRLVGDAIAGPYRCEVGHGSCSCERPQDGPWVGLSKQQYESQFPDGPTEEDESVFLGAKCFGVSDSEPCPMDSQLYVAGDHV